MAVESGRVGFLSGASRGLDSDPGLILMVFDEVRLVVLADVLVVLFLWVTVGYALEGVVARLSWKLGG